MSPSLIFPRGVEGRVEGWGREENPKRDSPQPGKTRDKNWKGRGERLKIAIPKTK
jgi:hypothetical protein